ncbi:MAG TPA: GTP-binding protein [Syntrophorhabdaceae bacterium]|nr:GTP-binding protein [Syntrophorhabdaceae bacterium]
MIPLNKLQPTGIINNPDKGLPELIDNILIRTFFEPMIKDKIGWVGVSYRLGKKRSWTFKIQREKGIYCLSYFNTMRKKTPWITGVFNLQYFPEEDEQILDMFSMGENILRADPQFHQFVRNAPENEDPLEYAFTIGKLMCTISKDENTIFISFIAPLRWRTIQIDGLSVTDKKGGNIEVLQPGSFDRNVPSFKIGWKFFDKMALTFCYHLKDYPDYVILKKRYSHGIEISKQKTCLPSKRYKITEYILSVGFSMDKKEDKAKKEIRFANNHFPVFDFYPLSNKKTIIWSYQRLHQSSHRGNPLWYEAYKWSDSLKETWEESHVQRYYPSLFIFTGFLGSGKTTLINSIAEYYSLQHNRFIAVIQNEIGTIDIDSTLIDGALNITSLDDGCVCCTVRGELRTAVRQVCTQYNPDIIILETTGVADPKNIIKELPSLSPFVKFDSLITVVDGKNLKKTLEEYPVAKSQIAHANLIILNKTDLLNDEEIKVIEKMLTPLNNRAPIIKNSFKKINPSVFFSFGETIEFFQKDKKSEPLLKENTSEFHHTESLDIASIRLKGKFKRHSFINFLNQLPNTVYRAKGIIYFDEDSKPLLLQYVSGHYELSIFSEKNVESNLLVFIGQGFKKDVIEYNLKAIIISD